MRNVFFLRLLTLFSFLILGACVNTDDSGNKAPSTPAIPGSLDSGFGSDGVAVIDISSAIQTSAGKAVQVLSDGKLITAAETRYKTQADQDFTLLRLNADGSLDSSASNNDNFSLNSGVIVTDLDNFSIEHLTSMARDSHNNILLSGHMSRGGWNFASARFSAAGDLDNNFGDNNSGITITTLPVSGGGTSISYVHAMAVFADDSYVLAGRYNNGGSTFDLALAYYDASGKPISNFDNDGIIGLDYSGREDHANAVAVVGNPTTQADSSRIFVAGFVTNSGTGKDFIILKYDLSGQLDGSFNSNGSVPGELVVHQTPNDSFNAIAIQSDGKIVAAGTSGALTNQDFTIVRYNSDASKDDSFNGGAIKTTDFSGFNDEIKAIAIDSQGRIVAAGVSASASDVADFAVVRYMADGSEDPTFGDQGKVIVPVSAGEDVLNSLFLSSGQIVLVGSANAGTITEKAALVRVNQ